MTKGDRRNFKLFARLQDGDKKYVQLFDAIDKQSEYDEPKLLEQFKGERFTKQFSVAKNYLYNYILKTLHIFHKDQYTELSTLMHQIQILMGKNLYDQSRKLVRKAKHLAERQERFQETLYLLEYERMILHRTQQMKQYEALLATVQEQENKAIVRLQNLQEYKHLYDEIYVILNRANSARGENEVTEVNTILSHPLLQDEDQALSTRAQLKMLATLNECHMFKHDFAACRDVSKRIMAVYEDNESIRKEKNLRYINTVSNLGIFCYYLGHREESFAMLSKMKSLETYSQHEKLRVFEKYYHFKIALCIEMGAEEEGRATIESFIKEFKAVEGQIMKSIELAISFFVANFFVMAGDHSEALPWVNHILNEPKTELRTDIQCMARILNLIIHLELGNRDFVEYNLKSTARFLSNRDRLYKFERIILKYLRYLAALGPDDSDRDLLVKFSAEMEEVLIDPLERKALNLFDVVTWIKSRQQQASMMQLVQSEAEGVQKLD
ncbi:MAG: hypothetical protein AAF998_19605 [Bacteroidota bacterium]